MECIRSHTMATQSILLLLVLYVVIRSSDGFATHQIHRTSRLSIGTRIDSRHFQTQGGQAGTRKSNQGRQNSSKGGRRQNYKQNNWSNNPNGLLNRKITQQNNAAEVLQLVASTKGALTTQGGGGKMNSINFSTSIHRIGRYVAWAWQNPEGNDRSQILADPRFALLIASAGEALGGASIEGLSGKPMRFGNRELSNMAWALAKLKMAPPSSVEPIDATEESAERVAAKAEEVRKLVYETARNRKENPNAPNGAWIPALSQLCGYILDNISYRVTTLDPKRFQLQEFSNVVWAMATAKRCNTETFDFVTSSMMNIVDVEDVENLRPQEWSNSMWALATSGCSGPELEFIPFVANLMDAAPEFVDAFKPQELSNLAWATATILSKQAGHADGPVSSAALKIIRQCAMQVIKRDGENYKTQEITNTIWSFATVGFGLKGGTTADAGNEYTFLGSDDIEGDTLLMEDTLKVAMNAAKQIVSRFRSQELNNLAWAMARLGQKDEELLQMVGNELAQPKRKVTSQDIGTSLWSFATLEFFDDEIYTQIARKVNGRRAAVTKPQELSNVLWAFATAGMTPKYVDSFDTLLNKSARTPPHVAEKDPITKVVAIASQELMNRPQDFKPQELKDSLWSLSRLGVRYPPVFKAVALHLVGPADDPDVTGRGLEVFSPQGMGNAAWAYARQAQLAAEMGSRRASDTLIPRVTGRLGHYTASFIDIGESTVQKLFYAIAEADLKVHDNLSRLSPQDISNTAWAFGILGLRHEQFLNAVASELDSRLKRFMNGDRRGSNFNGQELANTLWALATLNFVRPDLLDTVQDYFLFQMRGSDPSLKELAKHYKRQELGNIAWVCAVFNKYPEKLIEMLYLGLVGVGEKPDPKYVQSIHKDTDMASSIVMSLLYLQANMALNNPNQSISLPEDFPDGWLPPDRMPRQGTAASNLDSTLGSEESFELELTSSKIQLVIANAFGRIGFDHVQEHVISSSLLAEEYGTFVTTADTEMLSLDLAQVDAKIGIEVDGPGHFVTRIDNGATKAALVGHDTSVKYLNGKYDCSFDWNYDDQEVNGSSAMKSRMLGQLGWKIVNVPFWEWDPTARDPKKQEAYCRSKLADASVVP